MPDWCVQSDVIPADVSIQAATEGTQDDPALLDIAERRVACLTLLLDAGANAAITDGEGHTALGYSNLVAESGMPSVAWGVWDDPPPLQPDHLPWGTYVPCGGWW